MFRKIFRKIQNKNKGTEHNLARAFHEEAAYRNYRDFMDKAIKYFEKHEDKTDIPSYIKAQNLFNSLKQSGELDEFNRPVKVSA